MSLSKGQHSLVFLHGIEKIVSTLESTAASYEEIIEEAPVREIDIKLSDGYYEYKLGFIPTSKELDFYFELRAAADLGAHGMHYTILFKPQSAASISEKVTNAPLNNVLVCFKDWVNIIAAYGKIKLTRKEKFAAESAEQFYADFELTDEDANTSPFDNDKQLVLYKLLDYIKQKVEQEEGVDAEQADIIINEIRLLQASIPNVTKAAAVKGLSKIFAKTKAFSLKLMADFFDIAKKEALKAAIYGGLHEADTLLHSIHMLP